MPSKKKTKACRQTHSCTDGLSFASTADTPTISTASSQQSSNSTEIQLDISPLLLAVAEGSHISVLDLLAAGADPNESSPDTCTPVVLAVKSGNLDIVNALVEGGACCESDAGQLSLLHHAACGGHQSILRYLLDQGKESLHSATKAGCTPLYSAAQHGHVDCVECLLELGADREQRTHSGATPLYIAADRGHCGVVDVLLAVGCAVDVRTNADMTPFLVAAFNGHTTVLRSLLDRDVDLEQRGPAGGTALYMAAQERQCDAVAHLLEVGAQVDSKSDGDLTPSLIATMQGYHDILRLLFSANGALDVSTTQGSTLGIMAARHGQTAALEVIVEFGGVGVLEEQKGRNVTPLAVAKSGGHTAMVKYIEKTMAARKASQLAAWEASLPDLLEDLVGKEERKEARSKRKSKAAGKAVPVLRKDPEACVEEAAANSGPLVEEMAECAPVVGVELDETKVQEESAEECNMNANGDEWVTVGRKKACKTSSVELHGDSTATLATCGELALAAPVLAPRRLSPPPSMLSPSVTFSVDPMSSPTSSVVTPCGGFWPETPPPPGLEDVGAFAGHGLIGMPYSIPDMLQPYMLPPALSSSETSIMALHGQDTWPAQLFAAMSRHHPDLNKMDFTDYPRILQNSMKRVSLDANPCSGSCVQLD